MCAFCQKIIIIKSLFLIQIPKLQSKKSFIGKCSFKSRRDQRQTYSRILRRIRETELFAELD